MSPFFTNSTVKKAGFVFTLFMSLASFYFEYVLELNPCPLCIMQRLVMLGLAVIFFLCVLTSRRLLILSYSLLGSVIGGLGVFFASRQLYLQSLPTSQQPACGPGFNALIKYFPLKDVMHVLFYGSGDCAKVDWHFFGLPMPFYSLLAFTAVIFMLVYLAVITKKAK